MRHLQTDLFGLNPNSPRQTLSLTGRFNMDELNIDRGQGRLAIDHISLTSPQRTLSLDELNILFSGNPEETRMIYLRSPYLSATLRGHYVLSALIPDLRRTLYHHFPSLDFAQRGGASPSSCTRSPRSGSRLSSYLSASRRVQMYVPPISVRATRWVCKPPSPPFVCVVMSCVGQL